MQIKRILNDVLTDPETGRFTFILFWGSVVLVIGLIGSLTDTIITGTFEAKDFFESTANYLLLVGGVHGGVEAIKYGIRQIKKRGKKNDN